MYNTIVKRMEMMGEDEVTYMKVVNEETGYIVLYAYAEDGWFNAQWQEVENPKFDWDVWCEFEEFLAENANSIEQKYSSTTYRYNGFAVVTEYESEE